MRAREWWPVIWLHECLRATGSSLLTQAKKVIDLNNVPLVVGTSHIKWHLPSSNSAEHRGRTEKVLIRDHKAVYDYRKQLPVRLTVDRNGTLEECHIHFEVVQDYAEGVKGGRVVLGNVKLNLSEYVDRDGELRRNPDGVEIGEDGEEGITRRYLMHESKINSTLKVGILMKQTEGEKDFIVPPLKTATVFGGIAGIVATEAGDPKPSSDRGSPGGSEVPLLTKKTRELSESQDMYRRTLAATWACRSGELPPDKLVEDLFAGGDGGSMRPPERARGWGSAKHAAGRIDGDETSSMSDAESRRTVRPAFLSPDTASDGFRNGHGHGHANENGIDKEEQRGHRKHGTRSGHGSGSLNGGSGDTVVGVRGSMEQQMPDSIRRPGRRDRDQKEYKEVTEFDIREDLRSWMVSDRGTDRSAAGSRSKHDSAYVNQAILELQGM